MKTPCLPISFLTAAVVSGLLLGWTEANGIVACQKNKVITLRPEACRKKETALGTLTQLDDRLGRLESLEGIRAPAACANPEPVTQNTFGSEAELRTELTGVWLLCPTQGSGLFGGTNDAGLEILNDGQFFVLKHDDVGGLARDSRARGHITIIDTSNVNGPGAFQVNFEFGSGGFDIEHPAFSASFTVTVMDLVGMTGDFTYVRRIGN